ncbi:biopolymer transporter ExbD [Salicola sp. Rm-C-2C1-2]|uniref:ExbD/TolR family protein n=1 Tax=Salicola sp. Rm-C-2C1-2 TaxID=3141321 RepID=UPI0032E4C62C
MKFRRQSQQEVSVNLTPLIDVVFLLLIFFMVSTTFTRETELQIDLPEAEGNEAEQETERIEVEISADGVYSVNGERLEGVEREALNQRVERVADGNTDLPFIITADADARHELVVRAMDIAGSLGFTGLSISTQESPDANGE